MPTAQDLVRLALGAAQSEAAVLDAADLALMVSAVQMNAIERLTPAQRGSVLARALMAPFPLGFFRALRDCAGLRRLLPELEALFGVPRLTDATDPVDVGEHQLRVLMQSARRLAPMSVRVAALLHRIGMGVTPQACWPSHPGHDLRGLAMLDGLARRIALPQDALDLARLAVAECERIQRASDMRAGAIAALLERTDAGSRPGRFELLLEVCICDHAAHVGHGEADCAQAPRLRRALAAYLSVQAQPGQRELRAEAIARALRSAPDRSA